MTCLVHPESEAAGPCEYCGQPHCAGCLRTLLGRRYCPSCAERVTGMLQAPRRGPAPGPTTGDPPRAPVPGWLSALIYLIGFLLIVVASQTGLAIALLAVRMARGQLAPGGPVRTEDLLGPAGIGLRFWCGMFLAYGWGSLLLVVGYTALLARFLERRTLAEVGLAWSGAVWRDLALGMGLAALLFVSIVGVGAAFHWFSLRRAATAPEALAIIAVGLLILLPLAAVEEISMRGYILPAAGRSWGPIGGVIASSVVFAGLHTFNPGFREYPLAPVGLVLAGVYFASAYLITRRLWLPIFIHAGWNLMEGPVFGLPVSGQPAPVMLFRAAVHGPALWTGGSFGPEAGLLVCLLLVAHTALLWMLRPLLSTR